MQVGVDVYILLYLFVLSQKLKAIRYTYVLTREGQPIINERRQHIVFNVLQSTSY